MDILVPDSWLKEFVRTKASPSEIAKKLSLCGPSVERVRKEEGEAVYAIEVTTNRIDSAGVAGLAREVAAILPRFGIRAQITPLKTKFTGIFTKKVKYLTLQVDTQLCPRSTAVLIKNVTVKESPAYIQKRLRQVGVRPLNNVIDISNYLMHELGQPMHTFDYDKIGQAKMILRESRKGETLVTLDGQKVVLPGGDIAIEDGDGQLIDLPGIMGGENSMIDANTKNVLLFVQTYEPAHIRKTSMTLAKRSEASSLFEKGLDPEMVGPATLRAVDLFQEITRGKAEKQILDIYPRPYKPHQINLSLDFINQRIGVDFTKPQINQILIPLGFSVKWQGKNLSVSVPSFRALDVTIPEDIVEEIARIHGYHNLPNTMLSGKLPQPLSDSPFNFEIKIKNILKSLGGVEVYTLSLVSQKMVETNALRLKNPLGSDNQYLRTSLRPSLVQAAKENAGDEPFHLFEIANIYPPKPGDLPRETMYLAGILAGYQYRDAKGIVETLLSELNISAKYQAEDKENFVVAKRVNIKASINLGEFGALESGNYLYYEFEMEKLRDAGSGHKVYQPISKFPPQIEDLTLTFPSHIRIGEVIETIQRQKNIKIVELKDVYEEAYTLHILFHSSDHTLTNDEVKQIRQRVLKVIQEQFGGTLKEN